MSDYFRARVVSLEATEEFPEVAQHEAARRYAMKHDPRLAKLRADQCLAEVSEALAEADGADAFRDLATALIEPEWYLEDKEAAAAVIDELLGDGIPPHEAFLEAFDKDVEGLAWTLFGLLSVARDDVALPEAHELVVDVESVHPDGVLPGTRDTWAGHQAFAMRLLRDFEAEHVHLFESPPIEETYGDDAYEDKVPFAPQVAFAVDVEPDDFDEGGRVWIYTSERFVAEIEPDMSFHSRAYV